MEWNYRDVFISAADDCSVEGEVPRSRPGKPTVAEVQLAMLKESPYRYSQEDVLFESSSVRLDEPLDAQEREDRKRMFLSRPQACLRASPLVKRYGWGIHFDSEGKAAAYPAGSEEYLEFQRSAALTQHKGMRSKRA